MDVAKLAESLGRGRQLTPGDGVDAMCHQYTEKLEEACRSAMPRTSGKSDRRPVYWWCAEVAAAREACNAARRQLKRWRRRQEPEEEATAVEDYRSSRRLLKTAINASKRRCWTSLCEEVDADPWGLPYKIAFRKLGARSQGPEIHVLGGVEAVAAALFPAIDNLPDDDEIQAEWSDNDAVTADELAAAAKRLGNKKAPGPDGLPNEAIRAAVEAHPVDTLCIMNECLRQGCFPRQWKKARLVLIHKAGKPKDQPAGYRPLCMLDGASKLLERIVVDRMEDALEIRGGLSESQYGFRKGRSTMDAIEKVQEICHRANSGPLRRREHCLMVTLDVRNAFNSLPWGKIRAALRRRQIPAYLQRMVSNYLGDRWLSYSHGNSERQLEMTGGVPQGSVLGPLLWNITYDDVLRLQMPEGASLIGFADDLAVVASARDVDVAIEVATNAVDRVARWLETNGLQLASEKTEATWMSTRRSGRTWRETIQVGDATIRIAKSLRYLGVHMEANPLCSKQVQSAVESAKKTDAAFSGLLRNIGGPGEQSRRLLLNVVRSRLLYGAATWSRCVDSARNRQRLRGAMRHGALRVVRAYRTVSTDAVEVLARSIPGDLLVEERARLRTATRGGNVPRGATKQMVRNETMDRWQERWSDGAAETGRWTRELVPDVRVWASRESGECSHWLTQLLTGHGCFGEYRHCLQKEQTPECVYCAAEVDDARHVVFACAEWAEQRRSMSEALGEVPTPETLVALMSEDDTKWNAVAEFAESVLRLKDTGDRARDAERARAAAPVVPAARGRRRRRRGILPPAGGFIL
jgi:hypothetical protein